MAVSRSHMPYLHTCLQSYTLIYVFVSVYVFVSTESENPYSETRFGNSAYDVITRLRWFESLGSRFESLPTRRPTDVSHTLVNRRHTSVTRRSPAMPPRRQAELTLARRAQKQQRIDEDASGRCARFQRVLNLNGTSNDSLRSIVREIAPDSMISTREATDVGQARFYAVRHEFRLELTDGGDVFWELAHPSLLVTRMVEECPSLQEVFAAAFRRREPTAEAPWGLLIGWDENVPGSKLALQQSGKSMNMSFSFLELGRHALYHEACWFTPVVVQTKIINRVAGGWSRTLKDFLRLLLLSDGGFERGGVPIKINGSYSLVYARVRRALSDGACEYAYACMYFFHLYI